MQLALAVLGLLAALVPFLFWWAKRNAAPTAVEQRQETDREFELLEQQILEADARGDFAAADALRRVLLDRVAPERPSVSAGQQLPAATPEGDQDHRTG